MADVALQIAHLEEHDEERRLKLEEVEDRLDTQSENVGRLLRWGLEGNGDSADSRLRNVEVDMVAIKACVERVASEESIAKIAQAAVRGVIGNARDKDRTFVSKAKAFSPYFAAGCLAVTTIVVAIIR